MGLLNWVRSVFGGKSKPNPISAGNMQAINPIDPLGKVFSPLGATLPEVERKALTEEEIEGCVKIADPIAPQGKKTSRLKPVYDDVNWKSVLKILRGMTAAGHYRTINLSRSKRDADKAANKLRICCHSVFGKGGYSVKKIGPSTYRATRLK